MLVGFPHAGLQPAVESVGLKYRSKVGDLGNSLIKIKIEAM